MKNRSLFLKRLFISAALGALLTSPVLAMDEQRERPAAPAVAKLNAEQDKFMRDLQNTVVSGIVRPFHDVVGQFNMHSEQLTEEGLLETFTMFGREMIQEEVTKLNKTLERDLLALKGYHTAHKAQINTPVDVEGYVNALGTGLKEILKDFMGNVNVFLAAPTLAKSKELGLAGEGLKEPVRLFLEQFSISDHTKSLNAHFYGGIGLSEADVAARRLADLRIAAQAEAVERLKVRQEELGRLSLRLKPLTATVERLTAPIAGGRDANGYSTVNEGIMRLGNNGEGGGLPLLGEIRRLLSPLLNLRDVAYIEPREGADLGFSKDDAVAFYRAVVSGNQLEVSGLIVDSFTDMMNSPAYDPARVLRFCTVNSGGAFEPLYKAYLASKSVENQNKLAEAILKLGVAEAHSTRLLHPLALTKAIWDQKLELRGPLLDLLPSYFMLMADQVGKCANGATGRTILMTRLLAEALTKAPLQ